VAKVAAEVGSTANTYEILAKLATGGMADIFLARGESVAGVERHCVLKRILRERANDAQFVQMFVDEARLAAQLQHPNIASVYDVGKLGDSYFFTMEYVHGETVRSLLHRSAGLRRPVPLACALTIIAGAAAGLHHAHERKGVDGRALGIVHRDVSPSNLMISYEGNVKVVDFGVAKAAHRAIETRSGTVKGKISYLSPEQCRGEPVDRRSDLFSLGIVMWEMLMGERLYRRASDFANMSAIVHEEAVPPSVCRPDVPPDVDRIVLRLLAKSSAERFQSAEEVVDGIEAASVRAGIMVSTAAVGRFVRELFGQRVEPWLELALKNAPRDPVSLATEPMPHELALSAADLIELELANFAEVSAEGTLDKLEDSGEVSPVAASAPSSTHPEAPVPVAQPRDPASELLRASPRAPGLPIAAAPLEIHPPVVPPPPFVTTPAAAPSPVAGTGSQPVVMTIPSSATPAVRTSPAGSRRPIRWPLVAVVGGAAVAGVLATWLMMRAGSGATPGDAPTVAVALATPPDAAPPAVASLVVAPTEVATPDATLPIAIGATDGSDLAIDAEDIEIIDAGPGRPGSQPVSPPPAASPPVASPPIGPRRPPLPSVARLDDLKALYQKRSYAEVVTSCGAGVTAEIAVICVRAACKVAKVQLVAGWLGQISSVQTRMETKAHCQQDLQNRAAIAPASPPRPPATADELAELTRCGATRMNRRLAPDCTRAACLAGESNKAIKWVAYIPTAERTALTAQCKLLGIDLTAQKLDCAADAAACP
jgi:serine/threonine protein kinase